MEHCLFQHALQLADVAGPRVTAEPLERIGGNLPHSASQLAAVAAQVIVHEDGHVFRVAL
jgi:hypothetical protein